MAKNSLIELNRDEFVIYFNEFEEVASVININDQGLDSYHICDGLAYDLLMNLSADIKLSRDQLLEKTSLEYEGSKQKIDDEISKILKSFKTLGLIKTQNS